MKEKYPYLVSSLAVILVLAIAGCFAPTTSESLEYPTLLAKTPIPPDMTCSIYSKSATYAYNGFAFTFNQKNPPMFINYTVIPKNVTVNKVFTDTNTKETKTWTYSDYSPSSWFEVTVRDNTTKDIILQDGFGGAKGYSTYLSRTLKVLKNGDLLVEFRGNDIQASATIWVKPHGNFDESRLSEFTNCMYWEGHRDTLATATPTTIEGAIYTWTPENQERR
jgi:hypothetical protein